MSEKPKEKNDESQDQKQDTSSSDNQKKELSEPQKDLCKISSGGIEGLCQFGLTQTR